MNIRKLINENSLKPSRKAGFFCGHTSLSSCFASRSFVRRMERSKQMDTGRMIG